MDADAVELRVLGCLLEKQRTTPDGYPLSLNALRLACNQSTNRDPVVEYDESTIRAALARLSRREWARLTSGQGSRAVKYRHLLDQALQLAPEQLAVLCVLLLRGPQTPGELKQRTERLHTFASLSEVERQLGELAARDLVAGLPRRPGQKEQRYLQLLGGEPVVAAGGPAPREDLPGEPVPAAGPDRLAAMEREILELRNEVAALRARLDGSSIAFGRWPRAAGRGCKVPPDSYRSDKWRIDDGGGNDGSTVFSSVHGAELAARSATWTSPTAARARERPSSSCTAPVARGCGFRSTSACRSAST